MKENKNEISRQDFEDLKEKVKSLEKYLIKFQT